MKARKIIALGVGALVAGGLGAVAAQTENVYAGLNIEKAVIAFPTTAEVDGQVVHVKEDGLAAARLALALFQDSITSTEVEVKATDTHMTEKFDSTMGEWFNESYVPDFDEFKYDLTMNATPTGDDIAIWFNWSLFSFNATTNITTIVSNETNPAIVIYYGPDMSPMPEFEGDPVPIDSTMYFYDSDSSEPLQTYEVGVPVADITGWDITFIDYEISPEKRALVQLQGPGASGSDLVIIEKDNWTVIWVDDDGNNMVEFFGTNETAANDKVTELQQAGIGHILKLKIGDTFFGVLGSQYIYVDWTYYWLTGSVEKHTPVVDGWLLNWNETSTWVYFNGTVELAFGDEFELADLDVFLKVVDDPQYRLVWYTERVVDTYTQYMIPSIDPYAVAVPDYEVDLAEFNVADNTKDVYIIGGWVSNKVWAQLEEIFGEEKVAEWKEDVMDEDGYALIVEPLPNDPDNYVIIAAGQDYTKTAEAIDELINLIESN
ncbi:hypothetical protein EP1X_07330 [Thermococcus sp. EP1]|uniref:hypothetical protein n=1 Tax=Thermococcus sp. EP1 TaxID=1591054 RepID=UPI0006DB4548|nr:hypothetical protein [Thermococcus sp. EP1]KPU62662.1 hypothetical protein EP1X_07330 [Thermococcus sp. EP1]